MTQYPALVLKRDKGFWLDPRSKFLFMVFLSTMIFFSYNHILYTCVLATIPLLLLVSNKQIRLAVTYGLLFILAVLANHLKGTIVLPQILNGFVVLLIALVLRLFPTFMMGYYIINSTKADEFISAMERWHISKKVLIPIAVVFRFIPTMKEEAHAITEAMRMRDIRFGTKKFWQNPGAMLEYRLIPLLISVVKIGDELSAAALTRGLGNSKKRTNIAQVGFGKYDVFLLLVAIALLIWALMEGLI